MEDMEAAYNTLKGNKIADGVRCIIIPGTMQIYRDCVEKGYVTAFIDAGAIVSTPTCGPCLGGYMGILAAGERCIATTNRNFVGRMGHVDSEVYLASPATAAASAAPEDGPHKRPSSRARSAMSFSESGVLTLMTSSRI